MFRFTSLGCCCCINQIVINIADPYEGHTDCENIYADSWAVELSGWNLATQAKRGEFKIWYGITAEDPFTSEILYTADLEGLSYQMTRADLKSGIFARASTQAEMKCSEIPDYPQNSDLTDWLWELIGSSGVPSASDIYDMWDALTVEFPHGSVALLNWTDNTTIDANIDAAKTLIEAEADTRGYGDGYTIYTHNLHTLSEIWEHGWLWWMNSGNCFGGLPPRGFEEIDCLQQITAE